MRAYPGAGQFDRYKQPVLSVLVARQLELDDLDVHGVLPRAHLPRMDPKDRPIALHVYVRSDIFM